MSQPTRSQTLPWDIFKGVVALILLVILILLLLRACGGPGLEGVAPVVTTQPSETKAASAQPIAAPVIDTPADGDTLAAGTVAFTGSGQPETSLELLDNDQPIGSTQVGADGRWSFEAAINPGQHEFVARSPEGGPPSDPVRVTVTTVTIPLTALPPASPPPTAAPTATAVGAAPGCPTDGVIITGYKPDKFHYVVGTCDTMSSIAAALGIRLKDLIAANPQIPDPDLIFPGQVLNLP